jgi:membrane carboxypeptidase/penicillin-binding protein PbpC
MLAGPQCPYVTEWFAPGTAPTQLCDWHVNGSTSAPSVRAALRLVSPHDGDAYAIPPGVDARYATLALRAEGAAPMSWSVDGHPVATTRWPLVPGSHTVTVMSSTGEIVTAHIEVQ